MINISHLVKSYKSVETSQGLVWVCNLFHSVYHRHHILVADRNNYKYQANWCSFGRIWWRLSTHQYLGKKKKKNIKLTLRKKIHQEKKSTMILSKMATLAANLEVRIALVSLGTTALVAWTIVRVMTLTVSHACITFKTLFSFTAILIPYCPI